MADRGDRLAARVAAHCRRHGLLPAGAPVGYSAHGGAEVLRAAEAGADYASLSPVFAPSSKSSPLPPLGIEALRAACRLSPIPIYALGGIDGPRAARAREAGAHGAAVIGTVLDARDPESAARELLAALSAAL